MEVPDEARMVLMQDEKFKQYYNHLAFTLKEYTRITSRVNPVTRPLLQQHLEDLRARIMPGLQTLTWTSMNIDGYLNRIHVALTKLQDLLQKLGDVLENRVDSSLKYVSRTVLVDLPEDQFPFNVTDFVNIQEQYIKDQTTIMDQKNLEVERAVYDLIELVDGTPMDDVTPVNPQTREDLINHYYRLMYHAILTSMKNSFNMIKNRVGKKPVKGILAVTSTSDKSDKRDRPFFSVYVQLDLNNLQNEVVARPSLDEIQDAINRTAVAILRSTKRLISWGQDRTRDDAESFFDMLAAEKEVCKLVLLLTGSIEGAKKEVKDYLGSFQGLSFLWKDDVQSKYKEFLKTDPVLADFDDQLTKFQDQRKMIKQIPEEKNIGVLGLSNITIREQLVGFIDMWMNQFSKNLLEIARKELESLMDYMKTTTLKFSVEVEHMDEVRRIMTMLGEIRQKESRIDWDFGPVEEKYDLLQKYNVKSLSQEEIYQVTELRTQWNKLKKLTDAMADNLGSRQPKLKKDLVENVKNFKASVGVWRSEYEKNGPGVLGIETAVAIERLNKYDREFQELDRKYTLYNNGEVLFGMPQTNLDAMTKTRKELKLLKQLYGLYQSVEVASVEYNDILWIDVVTNIDSMTTQVSDFQKQCKALPRALKDWAAYEELNTKINNLLESMPLLGYLCNKAMRPRHWNQVMEMVGKKFKMDADTFKLSTLLEANLLKNSDDIEDISSSATKELGVESKLREIEEMWSDRQFAFSVYKNRNQVFVLGGAETAEVQELVEDSLMALGGMASSRYAIPLKEDVTLWIQKLGEVSEVIESWLYLQMMWMNLEAVFTGGDIAKQLPQDSKRFVQIDKTWVKIMTKGFEQRNVISLCYNCDMLKVLGPLIEGLEQCQKSLTSYLETKRGLFPRFYFVSDGVLLEILSQGSDPQAIQPYFQACFDSIDYVEFDMKDKKKIVAIAAAVGSAEERVALTTPNVAEGNIEEWMYKLECEMRRTIKDINRRCAVDCISLSLPEFIRGYCAQMCLLGIQMQWTDQCQSAIALAKTDKTIMQKTLNQVSAIMVELCVMTTNDSLNKRDRTNIETMITIQVHQKDVFDEMNKKKIKDVGDFAWAQQARMYWYNDSDDCIISIADVNFSYCGEFLGCADRLAITPLTDRCYITLSQALNMCKGGAPAGPAGTGKTETTKDMARTLGKYCVVTNCGPEMDYKATAKIYKGLCMCGAWGCFDEFNRIDLEVLSVCAQQIACVLNAIRDKTATFQFTDNQTLSMNSDCGYFITMNPGYAGRQELPENLKDLFRGVAMMVPDRQIIMKVKLAAAGYQEYLPLSLKFHVLYQLCEQQLSKQPHYDFGLRNILSVLRTAGAQLRMDKKQCEGSSQKLKSEQYLLCRTLRDMNMSKFVAEDVGLFISLINDLFPGLNPEKASFPEVSAAIDTVIESFGFQKHPTWIGKVIQLYETYLVRHGIMVVGAAGCGKTGIISTLRDTLTIISNKHTVVKLNPKAITPKQMYGFQDPVANEWVEGIFTSLWKRSNDPKKKAVNQWMVMDGPVDAIWIEDLNTVLDDNRMLTCANGDRIPMLASMKAMFEPEDLRNASPATVSRAGIIFVSASDLGVMPIIKSWIARRPNLKEREQIETLTSKYVLQALKWARESGVRFMMPVVEMNLTSSCFTLLNQMLPVLNEKSTLMPQSNMERLFIFCLTWSFSGLFEPDDRRKFDEYIRVAGGECCPPSSKLIYDYAIDAEQNWTDWSVPALDVKPGDKYEYANLLVPTMDSIRTEFLMNACLGQKKAVLLVGGPGTAKTSIVLQYISKQPKTEVLFKRMNFSSATTPQIFHNSVTNSVDKRSAKSFGPPANKKLLCFLDDVSMPRINEWGDQVTLEIIRQLVELGYLWNLEKGRAGDQMIIEDLIYVLAMNHPGGGKNDIPHRMKRHCFNLNIPMPSMASIEQIFGAILKLRFNAPNFAADVLAVSNQLVDITMDLYEKSKKRLLPTPAKFHYIFNLRDVSRVFQGILTIPLEIAQKPTNCNLSPDVFLLAVWRHECDRVFQDKLISKDDKDWFTKAMNNVVKDRIGESMCDAALTDPLIFVDFLRNAEEDKETGEPLGPRPFLYEAVQSLPALRERTTGFMDKFNSETKGGTKINLVLFDDALRHMARISRIIMMPKGSALLVGVGGSGKQSLTQLASYISSYSRFQISASKSYTQTNLLEDIKSQYLKAGYALTTNNARPVTFVFTDAEVKDEGFLEFVNMILSTGEIPGLLAKDETAAMLGELSPLYEKKFGGEVTQDLVTKFFYDNVRAHLHIVLCFSPVGEKFQQRYLNFPALFSGTTIDWFLPWPEEALRNVADSFLSSFNIQVDSPKAKEEVVNHIAAIHMLADRGCQDYFQKFRRKVYVTPKSYLSFISAYKAIYKKKFGQVNEEAEKIGNGLLKLAEAEEDVAKMKIELAEVEKLLVKTSARIEKMIVNLKEKSGKAEKVKAEVMVVKNDLTEVASKIGADRDETNKDLMEAKPALEAAEIALGGIKADDIKGLTALKNPPNLIKRIFDGVLILRRETVLPFKEDPDVKTKNGGSICLASWEYATKMMKTPKFLDEMKNFNTDTITEETCELLFVYKEMDDFNQETAFKASGSVSGLCSWVIAMINYYFIARFVQPKIVALKEAEAKLASANSELKVAEDELNSKEAELKALNDEFAGAMAEKQKTEDEATNTKEKMDAANKLIHGLGGEKIRWTGQSKQFATVMRQLVGDTSRAVGFISYCGPFNAVFRDRLLKKDFKSDVESRNLPLSEDMNVIQFLADESTIGRWSLEGLPSDDLSVQNGIMTTLADRWPIMVDPQSQGNRWVKSREASNEVFVTNFQDRFFRQKLEQAMAEGRPMLLEDILETVDPVLEPVLNKSIIRTGRFLKINLPDKEGCEYDDKFKLYFTTKLANPHFTPELSASTTIIDFTVTIQGLEDQLLSIVVNRERNDLQVQRVHLQKEITEFKAKKAELEAQLLFKLANVVGNLLDDKDIIDVLNNTKIVSTETEQKLTVAGETQKKIQITCEDYRPVATRGSIIYFLICDMSLVNVMYQTSLTQFLNLFNKAMEDAANGATTTLRIKNVIEEITFLTFFYMTRGVFERHKIIYVLLLTLKIQMKAGELDNQEFQILLKGGAALDINTEKRKPAEWIPNNAWLNCCQLAKTVPIFRDLIDAVTRSEQTWKAWYDLESPESSPIPDYEGRLNSFQKLLIVRSFREDRMLVSCKDYILDTIGKKYLIFKPLDIEGTWAESTPLTPLIFFLSPGSNPNAAIEAMAKRKKIRVDAISMGQGQEEKADKLLTGAIMTGSWVLLQNTHLGLGFMNTLEGKMSKLEEYQPDFRVWITCEPHPRFPIGLLQMSIRMTDEPPSGVKAGLRKSFNWLTQDWIEAVTREEWKSMLYAVCFLHTIVQERRKFGPLGFNIPYEFNHSDLEASVTYMKTHMIDVEMKKGAVSWPAVSYMVCQAQYGGRITDDFDRILFNTYGDAWLSPKIFDPSFEFASGYKVLKFGDVQKYRQAIEDLKDDDHPSVFGMHANADLTFRTKQSKDVVDTIMDIQPKESAGGGGGPTREDIVQGQCDTFLSKMPPPFNMIQVKNGLDKLSGGANNNMRPLEIHLKQEIDCMDRVIQLTKYTCEQLKLAIAGSVIMTPDLGDAFNSIFDARVPPLWLKKSWMSPTLGLWFGNGLCDRTAELSGWLTQGRPKAFWLTGYFNPQGFLTSVQQEVTRRHQGWALDGVQLSTEVTPHEKEDVEKDSLALAEGVYVWGLFLEAAAWDKKGSKLCDAQPKKLFCPVPCMIVTAINKSEAAKNSINQYICPTYKIPRKTGQYYIFAANIKTEDPPMKWIMRGTSMLCSKDT